VGLAFAQRYRINPLFVGLCIINGTNAGGFSLIAVYCNIVDGVLDRVGISVDPGQLFLWTFIASVVINAVAFILLGGPELRRRRRPRRQRRGLARLAWLAQVLADRLPANSIVTGKDGFRDTAAGALV
jgi:hypothetical protein